MNIEWNLLGFRYRTYGYVIVEYDNITSRTAHKYYNGNVSVVYGFPKRQHYFPVGCMKAKVFASYWRSPRSVHPFWIKILPNKKYVHTETIILDAWPFVFNGGQLEVSCTTQWSFAFNEISLLGVGSVVMQWCIPTAGSASEHILHWNVCNSWWCRTWSLSSSYVTIESAVQPWASLVRLT